MLQEPKRGAAGGSPGGASGQVADAAPMSSSVAPDQAPVKRPHLWQHGAALASRGRSALRRVRAAAGSAAGLAEGLPQGVVPEILGPKSAPLAVRRRAGLSEIASPSQTADYLAEGPQLSAGRGAENMPPGLIGKQGFGLRP